MGFGAHRDAFRYSGYGRGLLILLFLIFTTGCMPAGEFPAREFRSIECLEDPLTPRRPSAVSESNWRLCSAEMLDVGFSSAAFWFRFSNPENCEPVVLTLHWNVLANVDFFVRENDSTLSHFQAGIAHPRSDWSLVFGDYPVFEFLPLPGRQYYLRVESDGILRFPLRCSNRNTFSTARPASRCSFGVWRGWSWPSY